MRAWLPVHILQVRPSITTYCILDLGPLLRGPRAIALAALPSEPAMPIQAGLLTSLEVDASILFFMCVLVTILTHAIQYKTG